ncbi:ATP-binding protein [Chryseosolibacter indicus]|uniref:histidine kinase n=1 Tax=Chryseosolibacter indicus TaxID=2782351 RepID=A0ABS5VN10_9BACT|nr:ATP-binding protein [Chryseosolibacter indicus]MBT1702835.1 response regulator [Chryseosolibacter indicus]
MESSAIKAQTDVPEFLVGGGEMGQRIREFDWSKTPLGSVDTWPRSLRTCVQIMLTSRQPIWIGWGKDLIKLYNDPYKAIVKGKHPWALGKPASQVWKDIWKDIDPMLRKVMFENEGTYVEEQLLIMERNGYPEETYYTFSYTPVAGDLGGTEGMICFNTDDTDRIISERQLTTLTQLGKTLTDAKNKEDVYKRTIDTVSTNQKDFPFVLIYEVKENQAVLVNASDSGSDKFPKTIDVNEDNELSQLCRSACFKKQHQIWEDLIDKLGLTPSGAWAIPPDRAIILPIKGQKEVTGLFVIGTNPYRVLDDKYLSFFDLITDQIATSLNNVHAIEEERKRLEALAEIDRAKTAFFSNISHEFRTPLTLLLGPMEDLLDTDQIKGSDKEKIKVAYRNSLRLQKLVNLLLDFSRIEAGRMEAHFRPVDIVSVTEDLASNFRSAIEKAGMALIIKKETIDQPVFVDMDMWEKIMLNLLSNAFKYTTEGTIEVIISKDSEEVEVTVKDTGIGIPQSEIDKIFERFHRVQNVGGRSQEGTGIGLAMVKELVKLHNGTISVESKVGEGSSFTVRLPIKGGESLFAEKGLQVKENSRRTSAYIEEASQWLPENEYTVADSDLSYETAKNNSKQHTVLLADDNADMRKYIKRLLEPDYNLIIATDGEEAFRKAIEHHPDLILSDIMMPTLDGFGLLKKLKSNLSTRNIPLIFLSARAGEEAKVEGIKAGADDYLTKPFSSKELMARVSNHIAISDTRRKTEKEFYKLFIQAPAHIHIMKGPEHVVEFFHPLGVKFAGKDITGLKIREAAPNLEGQGYFEMLDRVYNEGATIQINESKVIFPNEKGAPEDYYFNITYLPWRDLKGNIQGILQFSFDVTEQVKAKQKIQESEERLRIATEILELGTWEFDPRTNKIFSSEKTAELFGFDLTSEVTIETILEAIVEQDRPRVIEAINNVFNPLSGGGCDIEYSVVNIKDKRQRIARVNGRVFFDSENKPYRFIGTTLDITERKKSEQELKASEERFRLLANSIPQIVWTNNVEGNKDYLSDQWEEYTGTSAHDGLINFSNFIHPDDLEHVTSKWQDCLAKGEYWEAEYRLKNIKTNTYRWFLGKTLPLKDPKGNVIKWVGSASDIQELKEQSSLLERQVQERTKELNELNHSLQLSNEDLQQFAHVASHDLKEPIRKIKTYGNRLQDEYGTSLPEKANVFLSKILSASDRMYSMVNGVLSYSAITSLEQPLEKINLNKVFHDIELDLEVLIQEKRATIVYTDLPVIEGAPILIYQLWYNLINNSIKFSKQDQPPVINIASSVIEKDGKRFIKIILKDNGIGFEQQYAEAIFSTFTRLHPKDKYEGTGLGLSLCKKIAERHGGSISAKSKPNQGAEFTVLLPHSGS